MGLSRLSRKRTETEAETGTGAHPARSAGRPLEIHTLPM
ncbi:hypothetical protein SCOR_15475 [Sulfidibacter corallicola]